MARKTAQTPRQATITPLAGVYEEEIHPEGEHWVKILMPSGKVGTLKFPDELWDDDMIPNLWKRYYEKTRPKLEIA